MTAVPELEKVSGAPDNSRTPASAFVFATCCPTLAFAFWTLAVHLAAAAHFSFQTLTWIGPFAITIGIVCGIFAARACRSGNSSGPVLSQEPGWVWLGIVAGIVVFWALGVSYQAFWILSAVLLFAGVAKLYRPGVVAGGKLGPFTRRQSVILILMAAACAGTTYVAHHSNIDDAVYVGTAADAVGHPELPVLSHDVLYGGRNLPLMLPSYALESYELLIAFLARLLGGQPILWAHAIVPTAIAAILPLAWASLMRTLVPRHWISATALALVLISLPGSTHGFGNFAFVSSFVGKAILASIAIPLLYAFAWTFEETGAVWDWLLLAASVISCVGFSASGIFVAPVALAAAALGGWRPGITRRAALTLLPAIYPLACGLAVSGGFKALEPVFAHMPARANLAVTTVFGENTQYLFLFALLAAPFLVRESGLRWKLMIVALIYFLLPLNPFTFKLLAKFTTRDAVWRILWCVPVVGIAAAAILHAIEIVFERWGRRAVAVCVFLLICGLAYLAPYSSFATSNGVSYSQRPLKVPQRDYATARDAIAATPAGTALLAPDTIAVWVPTFVQRPPLVSVRELYDEEMGVHMPPQEPRERRELRELVSGQEFPPDREQELLTALPRYQVGLILATAPAAVGLHDVFAQHGYTKIREENGVVFFALRPINSR